jgi:hypothetical protein
MKHAYLLSTDRQPAPINQEACNDFAVERAPAVLKTDSEK